MSVLEKMKQYGREDLAIMEFVEATDRGAIPSNDVCKDVAKILRRYQVHRPAIDGWDLHEYKRIALFMAVETKRAEDKLSVSDAIEAGLSKYSDEDVRRVKRWYAKGEYRDSKEQALRLMREIDGWDEEEVSAWAFGLMSMVDSGAITLE